MLEEAPTGHETAKRKVSSEVSRHDILRLTCLKALVRDGFRCVVSGRYDRQSVRTSRELDETPGIEVVETECAHILSESTNVGIGEGSSTVYLDSSLHINNLASFFRLITLLLPGPFYLALPAAKAC